MRFINKLVIIMARKKKRKVKENSQLSLFQILDEVGTAVCKIWPTVNYVQYMKVFSCKIS